MIHWVSVLSFLTLAGHKLGCLVLVRALFGFVEIVRKDHLVQSACFTWRNLKKNHHTPHWCFDSDVLNLEMNLRGSDIFITFELPIHAHAISLHLFTSSLISFSDIYSSLCRRLVYLLKFTHR